MKRAQGLPISTIIVAALGIMVLVVLGSIFGAQIGKFGRAATECPGRCLNDNPPIGAPSSLYYAETSCSEFETELSGSHIPKNLPANAKNPSEWRCKKCCIVTG